MGADEAAEPFAQRACLRGHRIQFARSGVLADLLQHRGAHEVGLLQPDQQVFAGGQPLDLLVDGDGNRVEEVQAERIALPRSALGL